VGDNIGAKIADRTSRSRQRVAQAKAEVRRAAAVAVEQEMRAKTQEMRAKVVEAEALVPQAMADAFRAGNLGIMDYVRMKMFKPTLPCANQSPAATSTRTDVT